MGDNGSIIKQKLQVNKVCFISVSMVCADGTDDLRMLCGTAEQLQLSSDRYSILCWYYS